jgi:hypothetical protein
MNSRYQTPLGFLAVLVAAGVTIGVFAKLDATDDKAAPAQVGATASAARAAINAGSGTCGGLIGSQISLADLADAPYSLQVPDAALAKSISDVRQCISTQWAIRLDSGVIVAERPEPENAPNMESRYDEVSEDGDSYLDTVHGEPALVHDIVKGSPQGALIFVQDGVEVDVIGNGELDGPSLVSLADSLVPARR